MAQRHPIYIGLMYQGYVIIQSPLSVHILCISAHVLSVFEEIGIPIGILGHSKVILMTKVPQFLRERRDCKYSLYKLFLRLLKRWVEFCKLIWKKSNIWKLGMTCVSHLSQGRKNRGHRCSCPPTPPPNILSKQYLCSSVTPQVRLKMCPINICQFPTHKYQLFVWEVESKLLNEFYCCIDFDWMEKYQYQIFYGIGIDLLKCKRY